MDWEVGEVVIMLDVGLSTDIQTFTLNVPNRVPHRIYEGFSVRPCYIDVFYIRFLSDGHSVCDSFTFV